MVKKSIILTLSLSLILLLPSKVLAQQGQSSSVAVPLPTAGEIEDGMIICGYNDGNRPCETGFDNGITGVATLTPAVSFALEAPKDGYVPITNSGKAFVLVNTSGGEIKKGDYITSSTTKGVGQKAAKSGFVLGTALEDYSESDKTKVGKIMVAIGIRPAVLTKGAGFNLFELIAQGFDAAFLSPISAIRYVVAAIIAATSVVIGFWHIGKTIKSGVEALGRNPLAGAKIQLGLLLNILISLLAISGALVIAYVIMVI